MEEVLRGALVVGREGRQGRVAKTLGRGELPTHPQPQGQRQPNPPGQLVTSSFNNTNTQGWFDSELKLRPCQVVTESNSTSRNLEELFELTRRPSWALDSPRALLPELPIYKDTVRFACARRGGPRTLSTTTDTNLDCAFVENALFYTDP